MIIYTNAIKTNRAFILYKNIQHYSWKKTTSSDNSPREVKIYSSAGVIIQEMSSTNFDLFHATYMTHMEVGSGLKC